MLPRGTPVRPEAIKRAVLDVVGGLVAELAPPRAGEAIGLDDSLDYDLGLGSLERVELLLRLGQRFGVVLPDPIVASASTPRDLARAVATAMPALPEDSSTAPRAPLAPGMAAPDSARLLTDVLRWHAEHHPERPHLFLRQEDGSERPLHHGELSASASAVAAALFHEGLQHGDTVGLMLRTERAFFPCFLGILLAGGIPVPLYPPFRMDRLEEYVERQVGILRNAGARVLITFDEAKRVGTLLKARVPSLRRTVTPAGLDWKDAVAPAVRLEPSDPALIQYTSGSTGAPKGVLLTHEQPARQHPRHRPGDARPLRGRRGELAAAVPRHGAHRLVADAASTTGFRSRSSRRWPSSRAPRAGCAPCTSTGAPSPPRPTSPTTCASGRWRTRSWRGSTWAPGAWPSTAPRR